MTNQEIAFAFDSALSRKASRVIELFQFLWQTDEFLVVSNKLPGLGVSIGIWSKDEMTSYAKLLVLPRVTLSQEGRKVMSGYDMKLIYPDFRGTVEDAEVSVRVLTLLLSAVKKMGETFLILKGE